jgi:regulator of sigma E protease
VSLGALYIIPILGVLIILHELGHFWAAKRAGMRVEEFGIGIPPRLWGFRRGETLWSINAIPVGGFVKVLGEDGKEYSNESMQSKTVGQRALFITAGSIMNFLTALVLIVLLVGVRGTVDTNVYVTDVQPGTPAQAAGWQPGDRFVAIAGHDVDGSSVVASQTAKYAGEQMAVTLDRGGQLLQTTVEPRENPPAGEGRTGILLSSAVRAAVHVSAVDAGGAAEAMGLRAGDVLVSAAGRTVSDYLVFAIQAREHAGATMPIEVRRGGQLVTVQASVPAELAGNDAKFGATILEDPDYNNVPVYRVPDTAAHAYVNMIRNMGSGLISLVRGDQPLGSVAGPIGMGQLTSEVIKQSSEPLWVTLANIAFVLSLNLGLLNLLPLPALDGGRLAFIVVEIARRGKRVAPEREGLVHVVGLMVLLTLMFVIAFVDINRIFSGGSFIQ